MYYKLCILDNIIMKYVYIHTASLNTQRCNIILIEILRCSNIIDGQMILQIVVTYIHMAIATYL